MGASSFHVICVMPVDGAPCLTAMDTSDAMAEAHAHYAEAHGVHAPAGFRVEIACQQAGTKVGATPLRTVFPVLVPDGCDFT